MSPIRIDNVDAGAFVSYFCVFATGGEGVVFEVDSAGDASGGDVSSRDVDARTWERVDEGEKGNEDEE